MLRVLVLGASGFIGKHLTAALAEKSNIDITVFGKNSDFKTDKELRYVQGNFEDSATLNKALKNQDIVYHLISQTIPSSSWNNPLSEIENNLVPTLKLIELAAENGVKKICFASSGGTVYGL